MRGMAAACRARSRRSAGKVLVSSVVMKPGATPLTGMFRDPTSLAIALVSPTNPALEGDAGGSAVREVSLYRHGFVPRMGQLLDQRVGLGLSALVGDRHPCPRLAKQHGSGTTDTAAAPGHEDNLLGKAVRHGWSRAGCSCWSGPRHCGPPHRGESS